MTNKTGTSMSSIVITKKAIDKIKKSEEKNKRAKICIDCRCNQNGYCLEHSAMCYRVNYICLGIKDPYEYKMPKAKTSVKKKKKKNETYKKNNKFSKKNNKEFNKLMEKYKENPEAMKKKLKKKYKVK